MKPCTPLKAPIPIRTWEGRKETVLGFVYVECVATTTRAATRPATSGRL